MTQGIGINASGHNEQNDVVPNLHGSNFGYFMATINGYFCDHSFEGKVFMIKEYLQSKLSKRQYELMRMLSFEYKRWKCRITAPARFETKLDKLHLGCGDRHLKGWLNVDMFGSDLNLDIATGTLPFSEGQFQTIVSQHVIEHLTIEDELIPLLKACNRCMKSGGAIWLSTPDMEKVAKSYVNHNNDDMVADRQKRLPNWTLNGLPNQHFMNDMFHQQLEHRNLFDFELLKWTLNQAGFNRVERSDEGSLLTAFPEFLERKDDYQSVYVVAYKA
jgi:predicted SAM-dependent methyltransferase